MPFGTLAKSLVGKDTWVYTKKLGRYFCTTGTTTYMSLASKKTMLGREQREKKIRPALLSLTK